MHIAVLLDRTPPAPEPPGASTGFRLLDEMVDGFRPGRLWLVTGTPGQGITTLVTQWAGRLAVDHGWLSVLVSPREPSWRCRDRLVASVGSLSLHDVGSRTGRDADRVRATEDRLRSSPLHVESRGDIGIPHWSGTSSWPRALVLDDADLVGVAPDHLREVADTGALVVAALPRHVLVRGGHLDADLEPTWARAADLVVELRSLGISEAGPVEAGTARLTVLKNRWGPLFELTVRNLAHQSRFADPGGQRHPPGPGNRGST